MPLPALGAAELSFLKKQLTKKLPEDTAKRYRFLVLWHEGSSLTELCEQVKISRPTAVLWKRAFLDLRDKHLDAVERFGRPRPPGRPAKAMPKVRGYLEERKIDPDSECTRRVAKELHLAARTVRRVIAQIRTERA